MSNHEPDTTNECRICGFQDDSRVTMLSHLNESHTLEERMNALFSEAQPAEDTYA